MKLVGPLTIVIFLITFVMVPAAKATFTLGNLSGSNSYDFSNFDPHVAGPIGYVWPGSGENAYDGVPNVASSSLYPGYQAPYPAGNPPGAPDISWYQLQGNSYSPFGAVLTGSRGDLIFALNTTCTPDLWNPAAVASGACGHQFDPNGNGVTRAEIQTPLSPSAVWTTWIILIPPEFTVPGATSLDSSQIVSTLSNNYSHYLVVKLGPEDRYAPGWTLVAVTADGTQDFASGSVSLSPYYSHQFIQFTKAGEWYYARINGVTAPTVAGRYFFKMALFGGHGSGGVGNTFIFGVGPTLAGPLIPVGPIPAQPFIWIPPQNWPVLLVKGEIDPAIFTGTIRYAGYNQSLYSRPLGEAGRVYAKMTTRLDPYTGQARADLPMVDAVGYFNATAQGHYEVEGLAPGVYDLYASAAGYPQTLVQSGLTVLKGQSLHFDGYLQPGPVIHGNVYTKHQFGDEPWPGNSTTGQYMKIELFNSSTLSNLVSPSAGSPVSWTPLPCVAGGQEHYTERGAAGVCGDPRDGSLLAFPWHEYSTVNGPSYNDPANLFTGATNGYTRDLAESVCVLNTACSSGKPVLASDPEGVGPPQGWYVSGGTVTPFHFEMGVKGEYGAPTDLSGEVPQVYATWINGLTPGRYYVRAWTFRYVQTALDGSTFQEYYFDITPNEWAGDVTLPVDLRLSSWVNKTVYFHDEPNTLTTNAIHSGTGFLWGVLLGVDGHVYAANVTGLGLLENTTSTCGSSNLGCQDLPFPFNTPPFHYGNTPGTKLSNPSAATAVVPNYYYPLGCYSYDQVGFNLGANLIFRSNINLFQTGEFGAPSVACPFPSGRGNEVSALDKAGLNANSIATGIATIQFWGFNDTWRGENYGIPSGTYAPEAAALGYTSSSPDEEVSVTLSGSPTSISDHLILAPGFNVSVYSTDWERPTVARDWAWSGCQYSVGSFAPDYPLPVCAGSEIDIGWYSLVNGTAGTIADYFGAEPTFMPETIPMIEPGGGYFGGLFQGPGGTDCVKGASPAITCSQMDGGGRNVLPGYAEYHDAYFGQSSASAFQGGNTLGLLGFLLPLLPTDLVFTLPVGFLPQHFKEGEYDLAAYTYGYVQDRPYTVYAMNGQVANMRINLIEGVNVTLDVLFKKESIIASTPFNMSARVRLFNDQGQLVATWMSSEGVYVDRNGHAIAANGQMQTGGNSFGTGASPTDYPLYPFNNIYTLASSNLDGYNFLPGGVTSLHVLMAGLPQQPPYGEVPYEGFLTGTYFGEPVATGILPFKPIGPLSSLFGPAPYGACDFDLNCYSNTYLNYPWAYTGIAGAPDYTGGWTAEVDFVPWYANNTASSHPNCQSFTPPFPTFCFGNGNYYPPVNGLLMGESYHIIPGTMATSGISLTEDMALSKQFLHHSMAANHLGPYSQEGAWQISGTHNSGEASAIFEVDLSGFISGNVLAFTGSNEFRSLSWGTISVTGVGGETFPSMYTYDSIYQGFFAPGSYSFTINAPGYRPQTWSISITPGESATGQNIYIEQSQIPIPEFSRAAMIAFAALVTSLYLMKRRRK